MTVSNAWAGKRGAGAGASIRISSIRKSPILDDVELRSRLPRRWRTRPTSSFRTYRFTPYVRPRPFLLLRSRHFPVASARSRADLDGESPQTHTITMTLLGIVVRFGYFVSSSGSPSFGDCEPLVRTR